MANDVTLSANIKSNIPQEMNKAAGGFKGAATAAKGLGSAAATSAGQMDRLNKSAASAAKSAKAAAFNTQVTGVASGLGALAGALPSNLEGGAGAAVSTLQKTTAGVGAGAQIGMAFGPQGALVGGAIGGGIGLISGLFDAFQDSQKEDAEAMKQAAEALKQLTQLQNVRSGQDSFSPEFGVLTSEIIKLEATFKQQLEKGGGTKAEVEKTLAEEEANQKREEMLVTLREGFAETATAARGVAGNQDIFAADSRQQQARANGSRGSL